jgi:murein DD-endopeptidase MepM/ murein hydrolase activator NlpD
MSVKSIAIFFAGFAAGILFITVLLRQAGMVGVIKAAAPHPLQAPAVTQLPSDAPGADLHGLLIPVSGISPSSLVDNFNETHDGHRHEALDIMAARGTPVVAVDEGNVVKLFHSKPGGLTVYQFDDTRTWCFYYAHLDRYAQGLKEGTLLRKGDILGYVGSTGDASPNAPHLHFTIFKLGPEKRWWQGTPINPYPLLTANHP